MGTPAFAVPMLEALLKQDNPEVVAVVTSVDKPGGRGRKKLLQSAVKKFALEKGLLILQPKNLKAKAFFKVFSDLKPDLAVVVAFRMLPESIWQMPRLGTMNLHGSLLPAYRGAAPINWAIINGESKSGLTTFLIAREIDTGRLIQQIEIPITDLDDAGSVHDKMMPLGADLVVRSVQRLLTGDIKLQIQDESKVSKAPKIFHEDCEIDVSSSSQAVYDFVRGLSPYPGAWLTIDGLTVKIYCASKHSNDDFGAEVGTFRSDGKKELRLVLEDGHLRILELQMQGKRRMDIASFLNGYDLTTSEIRLKR